MKKNDLRSTLGAIRTREELVRSTMEKIEAQRAQSEKREESKRFDFSFGMRLAGAMCALMIVVGIGIYGARINPPLDTGSNYGFDRAHELNGEDDASDEASALNGLSEASLAIEKLAAEAEHIDGDWAIISGTAEACYFAGGEEADGESHCIIAMSVEKVERTSGISLDSAELSAEIVFESDAEWQNFINGLSSKACFLLSVSEGENGHIWTVEKFIYEK